MATRVSLKDAVKGPDPKPLDQAKQKALDAKHLIILDPSWLHEFPKEEQPDVFFRSLEPILGLRIHAPYPYPVICPPLEIVAKPWHEGFLQSDFNAEKARSIHEKNLLGFLAELHDFIVLARAKAMCQKLWANCAELCLLALKYRAVQSTAQHTSLISTVTKDNVLNALK
ncbi:hypothetical protein BDZ45DRAFT_464494 [Acephala macrosclerotiorum]|nr:hypothetical protein BDZ45DRAFT_464494 [Acephala macrosclerotiorum]